jgi:hypothetical protein
MYPPRSNGQVAKTQPTMERKHDSTSGVGNWTQSTPRQHVIDTGLNAFKKRVSILPRVINTGRLHCVLQRKGIEQATGMDAFITRKRPLASINDTNADYLPPSPQSSLIQPSSPPTKKAKSTPRRADPAAKVPRAKKAPSKKATQTPGHCSLDKKTFGDRIKSCLALEKYAVQRMSFKVSSPFSKI